MVRNDCGGSGCYDCDLHNRNIRCKGNVMERRFCSEAAMATLQRWLGEGLKDSTAGLGGDCGGASALAAVPLQGPISRAKIE